MSAISPSGRSCNQRTGAAANSRFSKEAPSQTVASANLHRRRRVHRSKQHRYDKRKFMERWPERKYQLASPPLTSCDGQICTLTGLVDWVATNSMTRSGGKAEVEYRVLWTEQSPQIT